MENGRNRKKNTVWIVIVVLLLLVTNLATYFISKYYPVFTGDSVVIETGDKATSENVSKLLYLIDQLNDNYLWDIDNEELWNGIYKGLMEGTGDIYSEYMTKEEYEEYEVTLSGSYSGIGVQMTGNEDGNVIITGVFKDTPAYNAGIKVGDIIASADGESLLGQTPTVASTLIKGEKGTEVVLIVLRDGKEMSFTIKRDTIDLVYVNSKMLQNDIGYINITEFETNTYSQFSASLNELDGKGMKGLILDLRQNPGGLVSEAVKVADDLLPKCEIIYTKDKNGNKSDYTSDAYMIDVPVVVLVDGYSASSSEILTVALKDNEAADIVGTRSYGKGIVQILIPLSDGSLYKYTYAEYYGPNGTQIHGEGITPDYVVELPEEYKNVLISDIPYSSDTQLQKAVELMEEKIGQ